MGQTDNQSLAVFRFDAGVRLGGGHAVRCSALAEALERRGWRCGFAIGPGGKAAIPALAQSGKDVIELDASEVDGGTNEAAALRRHWPDGCALLVVDHYGLDAAFESACRPWAASILVIDDLADRRHDCDLLSNAAPGCTASDYHSYVPAGCRFLLGSNYALLRPEFSKLRRRTASVELNDRIRRVFVGLGATDPDGATVTALDGIAESGLDVEVDVVLGAGAPHLEAVRHKARQLKAPTRVHADSRDVAGLMDKADLAIGAAGTSSWERCCLGLPTVMVVLAANQRANADALSAAGAVRLVGREGSIKAGHIAKALADLSNDVEGRLAMANAASSVCDGLGAARVMMELCTEIVDNDGLRITLRPATIADGEIMLSWQRDQRTRSHFRNPAIPGFDEHFSWLREKLGDRNCLLNIIERGNIASGVLRFDLTTQNGVVANEVSILIAPDLHGRGIGKAALALGRMLLENEILWADVQHSNSASAALFRSAGFRSEDGIYRARATK